MSRYYSMSLEISRHRIGQTDDIQRAAEQEWPFDDWFEYDGVLTVAGTGHLVGGETEREFAMRVSQAIWRANGRWCCVEVSATYMENLPFEIYRFEREHYVPLKRKTAKKPSKKNAKKTTKKKPSQKNRRRQ